MRPSTTIAFSLFLYRIIGLQCQLIPDCDLEFSSQAIGIIRSKIDDPVKLNRIETILSACNKSRMQKLTEISVFLLEKSVFPSRVVDEIRSLQETLRNERTERLERMRQNLPLNLGKTMDEVSTILWNNSLSGNEKVLSLSSAIGALPREYRRLIEQFLNREATRKQVNPKAVIGGDFHSPHSEPAKVATDFSKDKTNRKPKLFTTKNDVDRFVEEDKKISPSTVIRKNDMPPLDASWTPELLDISPGIYNYNNSNTHSIDLVTKDHKKASTKNAQHVEFIEAPMDPIVPSNRARSYFAKTSPKYTTTASIADQVDDADLLNPRTSLLSDAVRLLESAIPPIKAEMPGYIAPSSSRYIPTYTFPLPEHLHHHPSHASSHVTDYSGHQLLPYRDDGSSSARLALSPPNNVKELDRFDTNTGRFASGVASRVALPSSSSISINGMVPNSGPNIGYAQPKPTVVQNPPYTTFPDYREDSFPEAVNQAKYEKPRTKIFSTSSIQQWSRNWRDQKENHQGSLVNGNPPATNRDTLFNENFQPPKYIIAPRPQQTLDVTTLPEFRQYRSPEEITGSHIAQEVYNIRHLGKPRFVKIDLLNE